MEYKYKQLHQSLAQTLTGCLLALITNTSFWHGHYDVIVNESI